MTFQKGQPLTASQLNALERTIRSGKSLGGNKHRKGSVESILYLQASGGKRLPFIGVPIALEDPGDKLRHRTIWQCKRAGIALEDEARWGTSWQELINLSGGDLPLVSDLNDPRVYPVVMGSWWNTNSQQDKEVAGVFPRTLVDQTGGGTEDSSFIYSAAIATSLQKPLAQRTNFRITTFTPFVWELGAQPYPWREPGVPDDQPLEGFRTQLKGLIIQGNSTLGPDTVLNHSITVQVDVSEFITINAGVPLGFSVVEVISVNVKFFVLVIPMGVGTDGNPQPGEWFGRAIPYRTSDTPPSYQSLEFYEQE